MANSSVVPEDPWQQQNDTMDTSMFPFIGDLWLVRPTAEVTIKIVTLLPIVFIGIFANVSLIHAIASNRQLRSNTTNLLILNMAVADLFTSLFCPCMFIGVDVFQNYEFVEIGCRFDGFLMQALTLVDVSSLSAVSYDRVSAIVQNCHGKLTLRSTHILIAFSWILALVVAGPLAFFRSHYARVWLNSTEKFCAETKSAWIYWHLFVGVSVWMPLAVMAICYTRILIKLNRYENQALKSKHPIVMRYKGRVTRILSLVVLAFIVSRVPFTALMILRTRQTIIDDYKIGQASSMYILWYVSRYLIFVSAALNPLLYGCANSSLRQQLAKYPPVFWIILRKRQEEESIAVSTPRENTLKPRSACEVKFEDRDELQQVPTILRKKQEKKRIAVSTPRENTLKPRSACVVKFEDNDELQQVPTISSTVARSKSSGSRFFRKLRINSVVSSFSGAKVEQSSVARE